MKKKWRSLRDTFLREKKKIKKSRSGDSQEGAELYLGKWSYYNLMTFLKDTTNPRISDGNISDEEDTFQECPGTYEDHDSDIDHIDNDDSNTLNVSEIETAGTSQRVEYIKTFESRGTPSIAMSTTNLSSSSDQTLPRKKKKK